MSDRTNPSDRTRSGFDEHVSGLLRDASSDAPPAPPVESFAGGGASRSSTSDRRRRWWATGGAIGLAGAAAAISILIVQQNPTDTIRPADVPEVTTNPSTAIDTPDPTSVAVPAAPILTSPTSTPPATTSVPATIPVEPTPLLLTDPGSGFDLDYAVSPPDDDGMRVKLVRYRDGRADSPAIELTIRGIADASLAPTGELDRQSWEVNGRTVYDDNELEGCLPEYCSVGLQWDETTNVSVAWIARPGTELDSEQTIEALVEFAGELTEARPDAFRPVVNTDGPTISRHGVVVAGPAGVIAFDGWEPEPLVLTTTPALKATGLPDGRVLVQTEFSVEPGELFILDPSNLDQPTPIPYWPGAIPADGSVSIDIEDAATIDGVPTLLLQVKNPSNGTLELASIDTTSESRRIIAEFPDATLGEYPKGFLDVDLRNTESLPAIGGVNYDRFDPVVFFASLDGQRDELFEQSVFSNKDVRAIGLDASGFLVSKDIGGPIQIRDQVGDQVGEIVIQDERLVDEIDSSLEVEPILLRTFPVSGSVWLQRAPDEWVEIGVDGNERNRADGTALTTTNQ